MTLRFCMARVRNQGYGLGNEMVPWARAFLAAQMLGAKLLTPAFGLNRRSYWRDFHTGPDDWIYNRALERLLPVVRFTEQDWREHGGDDVVSALRGFAAARGLSRRPVFLLITEGLWGGFHHVQAARDFMRATIYASRFAAANLLKLRARIDPQRMLVGMHVRLGDFRAATPREQYRVTPNTSLPLEWFCSIAAQLRRELGERVQFLVVSDGTHEQLRPLLDSVPCITTADLPNGDCSDVLALADSDLLVCSSSTYSHLAAFLSDSPYLWFAPNLYRHAEGCYSTGDATADLQRSDSARLRALHEFSAQPAGWMSRGMAVDFEGRLPASLFDTLRRRHAWRRWQADLVRGGVAPA